MDVKGRSVSHIDSCTGQHHAILELELDRRYTERVSMLEGSTDTTAMKQHGTTPRLKDLGPQKRPLNRILFLI